MLAELINLANDLDQRGLVKEAGTIDEIVNMLSKLVGGPKSEAGEEDEEDAGVKAEGEQQIEFHGETTENFDMCPGAVKAFNMLEEKVDDDSKGLALEALSATDELLGLERGILKDESATEEDLKKALELAQSVTYNAGALSQKLDTNLLDDFAFLNMHIEAIANLLEKN